ncbi:Protein ERP1 [Nakaseomyces bracarensis]|uniref:Protein ERP1 n=1 Tax=Nakaseomyces bracarensis TaxID=273131 RepID=A0ABR4NPG6_9SACH
MRSLILAVFILLQQVNCFYMFTNSGDRKCFYKELSEGWLLRANYDVKGYDSGSDSYIELDNSGSKDMLIDVEEVFDDNHRVVHQKSSIGEGELTFIAEDSGEHKICFQAQQAGLGRRKLRIEVDFHTGHSAEVDFKKNSKLKVIHEKINSLVDAVENIKLEQQLVREREEHFRNASERVNTKAARWTIFQMIVLVGICFWQISYLGKFFVKQKIV